MTKTAAGWTAAFLLLLSCAGAGVRGAWVEAPASHTALGGDLSVAVAGLRASGARLQLLRGSRVVGSDLLRRGNSSAHFPCGLVALGGQYSLRLLLRDGEVDNDTQPLDVRWPPVRLSAWPEHVATYPDQPVSGRLEFETRCTPRVGTLVPDLWLVLLFCGPSPHDCFNHSQVLFAEQVREYPESLTVSLNCSLFGVAGFYALSIRDAPMPSQQGTYPHQPAFIRASWSEKFVFNVHARSIFPCDTHGGVTALFQYPACILEQGDRVRLYARHRADVASILPPTSLQYQAERRFTRGQHSVNFDCDLFSERFVEYCFVYVSQALTGAVSDVRIDCVPTLPVSDSDSGGWSDWSPWTTCSSTCGGGSRNRYRTCDSPPPRYGAKFCEGPQFESEKCGEGTGAWDCPREAPDPAQLLADRPEVVAEVGPLCRCGCIVHLGAAKPRRLLATSSVSCPGRTFWLVQADPGHLVHLTMHHLRLPCRSQWLKVRDGDRPSARLLASLEGTPAAVAPLTSSGPFLLLEFFSDEVTAPGFACGGGFLAHAVQLSGGEEGNATTARPLLVLATPAGLTLVHLSVAAFLACVVVAAGCLGAQYAVRYRKYQRAAAKADCSRAPSSATLLSEVISLRRFGRRLLHDRLDEEEEEHEEDGYESQEPEYEVISLNQREEAEKTPLVQSTTTLTPEVDTENQPTSSDNSPKADSEATEAASSERSWRPVIRPVALSGSPVLRGPTPKAHKEKRNLERLLAASEFSLAAPDGDLELDYYDYNVSNAGAVPGSYLGMDPQYLLYIPPFAPGEWEEEGDELLSEAARAELQSQQELREFPTRAEYYTTLEASELSDREQLSPLNVNATDREQEVAASNKKFMRRKNSKRSSKRHSSGENSVCNDVQLDERPTRTLSLRQKSVDSIDKTVNRLSSASEKETRVEKSPSLSHPLDDIKFADDEDVDEVIEDKKENGRSYIIDITAKTLNNISV